MNDEINIYSCLYSREGGLQSISILFLCQVTIMSERCELSFCTICLLYTCSNLTLWKRRFNVGIYRKHEYGVIRHYILAPQRHNLC